MKEYAEQFYSSKAWQRTRKAYAKSKQNLCEICLSKGIIKPGVIVHHKTHIDPANIHDPAITLASVSLWRSKFPTWGEFIGE